MPGPRHGLLKVELYSAPDIRPLAPVDTTSIPEDERSVRNQKRSASAGGHGDLILAVFEACGPDPSASGRQ